MSAPKEKGPPQKEPEHIQREATAADWADLEIHGRHTYGLDGLVKQMQNAPKKRRTQAQHKRDMKVTP